MRLHLFIVYIIAICAVLVGISLEVAAQNKVVVIPLMQKPTDPPAPVQKTGQTTSYVSKDDGDHEAGIAWPEPRWVDHGNGTVTDKLTGLIWLKASDCDTFAWLDITGQNERKWIDAVASCNFLGNGFCGLNDGSQSGDWRLPTVNDLKSLVDRSQYFPALPPDCPLTGFVISLSIAYAPPFWSATTTPNNTNYAWGVEFKYGFDARDIKTADNPVLCVRDGL